MSAPRPVVALIGRPNTGKSTLFNRLTRTRAAIVHDRPGVTRDRHYGEVRSGAHHYTLIDTGGFDPQGDDDMQHSIVEQITIALDQADVIVAVLDGRVPPTSIDSDEMELLRRADKPVIYLANKADSDRITMEAHDLYRLGMDRLIFASALHGRGMPELEYAIREALGPAPEPEQEEERDKSIIRVAVVGRPNSGKSSLINRLLGEERLVVDPRPGTTRDPIDTLIERKGKRYLFVDTAGLRRKSSVARSRDAVEAMSVIAGIRAVERAEVVVLLCDADAGVAEQDAKVLGLAIDRGRAIVIGLNKADLLDGERTRAANAKARDVLSFVAWAPVTRLSAKTGRGVDRLLGFIDKAHTSFNKRITTGALNRFFGGVLENHPPPIHAGRAPRFYYITQAKARPPTFMIVTSHPDSVYFSYQRYVINALRKAFDFEGTAIRVHYRRKNRREKKRKKRKR